MGLHSIRNLIKIALEEYNITPEDIVQNLIYQGKITISEGIKYYTGELSLEEVIKLIKKEEDI